MVYVGISDIETGIKGMEEICVGDSSTGEIAIGSDTIGEEGDRVWAEEDEGGGGCMDVGEVEA